MNWKDWEEKRIKEEQIQAIKEQKGRRERIKRRYDTLAGFCENADVHLLNRQITALASLDESIAIDTRRLVFDLEETPLEMPHIEGLVAISSIYENGGAQILLPPLLPKTVPGSNDSARWIESIARQPLELYFKEHPIEGQGKMAIAVEMIYENMTGRYAKDFDNLEIKAAIDCICRTAHIGDRPEEYCLIVLGREAKEPATRISVFPIRHLIRFLEESRVVA